MDGERVSPRRVRRGQSRNAVGLCLAALAALSLLPGAAFASPAAAQYEVDAGGPGAGSAGPGLSELVAATGLPASDQQSLLTIAQSPTLGADPAEGDGAGLSRDAIMLIAVGCVLALGAIAAFGRRAPGSRPGAGRLAALAAGGVAACAACGALLVAGEGSAQAKVPRVFWGVSPQQFPEQSQLNRVRRGGVDTLRLALPWSAFQPANAPIEWDGFDVQVLRAARSGIEILPFLYSSPPWVARPDNTLPMRTRRQRAAWADFLRAAVRRYGPGGEFFSDYPGAPRRPIRRWQIWNEPNYFYFAKRPNPGEYGRFVKFSHRVVASEDPGAKIILGGMFGTPKERPPRAYDADRFLDLMYRRVPGVRASFDGVALHPYVVSYRLLPGVIRRYRRVLGRHRDAQTPLYLTEIGWGSQARGGNGFEKGPRGQVRQMRGAFRLIRRNQAAWRVARVYWFSLDDLRGGCSFCDSTGLFTAGFRAKAAWFEYVRFAGGTPR